VNDFEKNRIFFTVALIASSLAIYSILKDLGMSIYEPIVTIKYFYWIFIVILGTAIYLYAVSFIGENTSLRRTKKVADGLYKVAIILPILYFLYYIVCFLMNYYLIHNLTDYGLSSVAVTTDDYLFNFLTILPLAIFMFIIGVIGFDILEDFDKKIKINEKSKEV